MIINEKTIEKLQKLITEETTYRSGPQLVKFFNQLGFNDSYGQGFPSRWKYTQDRLIIINGTPELDKCIKMLFSPINFINEFERLDSLINEFNNYLMFDNWKIIRSGKDITFKKVTSNEWLDKACPKKDLDEQQFLKLEISYDISKLNLDDSIKQILVERIEEIEKAIKHELPLSAIFLCGSSLEGILLGVAIKDPKRFNCSTSSPKDSNGKVKNFAYWKLSELIDTATQTGLLNNDIKKFSHILRDFRNFIHPYEQLANSFSPDINTAKICCQVLKAAIVHLSKNKT